MLFGQTCAQCVIDAWRDDKLPVFNSRAKRVGARGIHKWSPFTRACLRPRLDTTPRFGVQASACDSRTHPNGWIPNIRRRFCRCVSPKSSSPCSFVQEGIDQRRGGGVRSRFPGQGRSRGNRRRNDRKACDGSFLSLDDAEYRDVVLARFGRARGSRAGH